MKAWIIGAAAIAAACAGAAQAQANRDLSGTWAFHSAEYSQRPEFSLRMSGVAEFRRTGNGRYAVNLMTQEVAAQRENYAEAWSKQDCLASVADEALTITCTLREAHPEGYVADNFQLLIRDDGTLTGNLVSNASPPVVFRKFH